MLNAVLNLALAAIFPSTNPLPVETPLPSAEPSAVPSAIPSAVPSTIPDAVPSAVPGITSVPSAAPTDPVVEPILNGLPWLWIAIAVAAVLLIVVAAVVLSRRHKRTAVPVSGNISGLKVGKVHEIGARGSQQDCFAVSPIEMGIEHGLLAVVADGMGGLSDGDKVSQAAVGAMLDGFMGTSAVPELVLPELLMRANEAVNHLLGEEGLSRSGSTLVAAYINDGALFYLSVGDSRLCLYRDGALYQLNREHVFKNELLTAAINGMGSFEQAMTHPKAGGLTSYLGMGRLKYVDLPAAPFWLCPGDKIVLMSDGVYNALSPAELARALNGRASQAAADIGRAVADKGYEHQDNYTAIVIECMGGRI